MIGSDRVDFRVNSLMRDEKMIDQVRSTIYLNRLASALKMSKTGETLCYESHETNECKG